MANLTGDQLAELERLANAAIRGPWEHRRNDQAIKLGIAGTIWSASGVFLSDIAGRWVDTADFIAAAHPQTVKALIADLREARGELKRCYSALQDAISELGNAPCFCSSGREFHCTTCQVRADIRSVLGKGPSDG